MSSWRFYPNFVALKVASRVLFCASPVHAVAAGLSLVVALAMLTARVEAAVLPVLDGLQLQLDATDVNADGLPDAIADGSTLSHWLDKSANSYNAAASGDPRYIAGGITRADGTLMPVVRLDGSGDWFQMPNSSDVDFSSESVTAFLVGSNSNNGYFFSKVGGGGGYRLTGHGSGLRYQAEGSSATLTAIRAYDYSQPSTMTAAHDRTGNTVTLYGNGVKLGATESVADVGNMSTTTKFTVGTNPHNLPQALNGDVAELLVYNRALGNNERLAVETYLDQKYFGQSVLAGGAPDAGNPNLKLWLDADDAGTFTQSGGHVTQWRDKSANGNHASVANGTPTRVEDAYRGRAAVDLVNADDEYFNLASQINLTNADGGSVFIVSRANDARDNINQLGPNANVQILRITGNKMTLYNGQSPHPATSYSQAMSAYGVRYMDFEGSHGRIFSNGLEQEMDTTNAVHSSNGFQISRIGKRDGNPWDGQIAEVLVYDRILSPADRRAVEEYLMGKYNIPVLEGLPSGASAVTAYSDPADGGNGHYYALITGAPMSWADAEAAAEAMTMTGYFPGYLATVTSQEEYDFLVDTFSPFPGEETWLGATDDPSLTPGASDGNFTWVTGEPFSFTAWASGQPNGVGASDGLVFLSSSLWNDISSQVDRFFLVELSVPEPSGMVLLFVGLIGLLVSPCRRRIGRTR